MSQGGDCQVDRRERKASTSRIDVWVSRNDEVHHRVLSDRGILYHHTSRVYAPTDARADVGSICFSGMFFRGHAHSICLVERPVNKARITFHIMLRIAQAHDWAGVPTYIMFDVLCRCIYCISSEVEFSIILEFADLSDILGEEGTNR